MHAPQPPSSTLPEESYEVWIKNMPIEKICKSAPIKFLIGPEKTEFFVNSVLIDRVSATLARQVTDNAAQGSEPSLSLPTVDEETFSHFVEFVYTGRYTEPAPAIDKSAYRKYEENNNNSNNQPLNPEGGPRNNKRWHDYTAVYLLHSKLYVLAKRHAIAALMPLTLDRLGDLRVDTKFYPERAGDLVAYARFAFTNTNDEDDALRKKAAARAAWELKHLGKNPGFKQLVREIPAFAEQFVCVLAELQQRCPFPEKYWLL